MIIIFLIVAQYKNYCKFFYYINNLLKKFFLKILDKFKKIYSNINKCYGKINNYGKAGAFYENGNC